MNRNDKVLNSLLAGALGDALGAQFENQPVPEKLEFPETLYITDDTQLTLATCETIIKRGFVDPESIANSFLELQNTTGIRGIGKSTLLAMNGLFAGGHWASVGASGERAAGNGAAMRIAPLAFLLDPSNEKDRNSIRDVCRITHRNEEAYAGAFTVVHAIRHLISAGTVDSDFLNELGNTIPDSVVADRIREMSLKNLSSDEFINRYGATGYVADTVPLAILFASEEISLLDVVMKVAQAGGDTDTIASITGQLIGLSDSNDRIEFGLLERVADSDSIQRRFSEFADFVFDSNS